MPSNAHLYPAFLFPHASGALRRCLVLGTALYCGIAGAAQGNALPHMQLQLERTAKASLMAAQGYADGFVQLRDSRTALAAAMTSLTQSQFEHCTSHAPDPETARQLDRIAANIPVLTASIDTVLNNRENLARMRAATKAITNAAPHLNDLLIDLGTLQAKSGTRDLRILRSAQLLFQSERLARYAARYASEDTVDPVVAFVLDSDKAKFLSAVKELENGSRQSVIPPATSLERAKLQEITADYAVTANALDALKPLLIPVINFKKASSDAFDGAEEMGKALRAVHSNMQARTICAVSP